MQTSKFQLGMIAVLALGLGYTLSSSDAVGYPAGAAVSLGTNPVWSRGGYTSSTADVITAPTGQDIVVSDMILTLACMPCSPRITMTVDGSTVGSFRYYQAQDYYQDSMQSPYPIGHSFQSGIHVPAGSTLTLSTDGTEFDYALSGYYAQP
jgi:hypothetical protein